MKKFFFVLVGGLMAFEIQAATTDIKKYGYVPVTFPRDPAEVNQFSEHILLGQILEPLVDTDKLGNVIPGIAKSWKFENQGTTIKFQLDSTRQFSNGKKLTSKDVEYTLNRVIEKKSQSSNFLLSVASIETPTDDVLVIKMKEPNVSILKALSRDQVGIVPKGWGFEKESNEPIIGTGPYRLVKDGGHWFLKKNVKFPSQEKIEIPSWKLIYFADTQMNVPSTEIPDYVPGASASIKESIFKLKGSEALKSIEQISYAQTSAWWHPYGESFSDTEKQSRAMNFVEAVFEQASKSLGFERATGVIPKGVAGHLLNADFKPDKSVKVKKSQKLKLAFVAATFDDMISKVDVQKLGKEYAFEVEVLKVSPTELSSLPGKKPDVVFAGWAGGFNDPEGFIALLPTFIGKPFSDYIGPKLAEIYKKARHDSDWTSRSELFRTMNSSLRKDRLMAPGWRIPFSIVGKPNLISEEATYRYTPRLHAVKQKEN